MRNAQIPQRELNGTEDITFALDIGTRSVVGIIGIIEDDNFEVIDFEQQFHAKRAMRDGQIEDIGLVAKVVGEVKTKLEERNNLKLNKVAIAAAGRSLKTIKIVYEQTIDMKEEITHESMNGMEYAALSQAIDEFCALSSENEKFYCVGYSVIRSALDDYNMSNLIGHKGNVVQLEMIVAFLPHNVVEGLYATMAANNLTVENLTLEPMAAIHVIVPKDIRLLNIALIDIGAGTSDIAISRNGGISAYDMVTVAGDEITERIMENYLTDFDEAERIKIALDDPNEEVRIRDILGNDISIKAEEIYEKILPTVTSLANTICERIIEINGNSPVAVFVVGGGSQIPSLCSLFAQNLKIAESRVTIGGRQGLKHVKLCSDKLKNPEFVTPIGIGAIVADRRGKDFLSITVNGNKIMLLRQGVLKVMDAILLAGIKPTTLIGVPQPTLNYYLNGEKRIYRGAAQIPGELRINGEQVSIDATISPGDELTVIPARITPRPAFTVEELLKEFPSQEVTVNGIPAVLKTTVKVGGDVVDKDYCIAAGDVVMVNSVRTLEDMCKMLGLELDDKQFTINDNCAAMGDLISNGDRIIFIERERQPIIPPKPIVQKAEPTPVQVPIPVTEPKIQNELQAATTTEGKSQQFVPMKAAAKTMPVIPNIPESKPEITKPPQTDPNAIQVCLNGLWKSIPIKKGERLLFVDMLNFVNIAKEEPKGKLVLKLNSKEATYTQPVFHGDIVEIRWED